MEDSTSKNFHVFDEVICSFMSVLHLFCFFSTPPPPPFFFFFFFFFEGGGGGGGGEGK